MNELESIEKPMEVIRKSFRTVIAWFFVIFSPFIFLFITVGFQWFKDWQGIMKFVSIICLSGSFLLLILLLRKWMKSAKSTGIKIFTIFIGVIVGSVHVLFIFFVFSMQWAYDDPVAEYTVKHDNENYTFYVCHAHSWQFFFDGGYEVWVHEPSSIVVERVADPVWKSEYLGDMKVSGETVVFYFTDDNLFSKRGSGNTSIVYRF